MVGSPITDVSSASGAAGVGTTLASLIIQMLTTLLVTFYLVADGPPKKLLTGFGGFNHDHGAHSLVLGPDHKWWMSHGDTGFDGLPIPAVDGPGAIEMRMMERAPAFDGKFVASKG